MPKRAKKIGTECEDHIFTLKPKQNHCRYNQAISISFCDHSKDKNKNKTKKCRNTSCLDCPIFNNDGNFATPTFILGSQKQYYQERGLKMKQQHQKKMIEYTDEKEQLYRPKPRTKNNFCSVCRQVYEDYLDHIQSEKHKKKINCSHFNRYILEEVQKFNPSSKKQFSWSIHTLSTRDQEYVEILQNSQPKKKIKTQSNQFQGYQNNYGPIRQNIGPPPHININHPGYCGPYAPEMNFMPYQVHQMPIPPPMGLPFTFNYNMNIFMNDVNYPYHSYSFGSHNPMMNYFVGQRLQFPRMEPNYSINPDFQNLLERNMSFYNPHLNQFKNNMEDKRQPINEKKDVIVIDDDQDQFRRLNLNQNHL